MGSNVIQYGELAKYYDLVRHPALFYSCALRLGREGAQEGKSQGERERYVEQMATNKLFTLTKVGEAVSKFYVKVRPSSLGRRTQDRGGPRNSDDSPLLDWLSLSCRTVIRENLA